MTRPILHAYPEVLVALNRIEAHPNFPTLCTEECDPALKLFRATMAAARGCAEGTPTSTCPQEELCSLLEMSRDQAIHHETIWPLAALLADAIDRLNEAEQVR